MASPSTNALSQASADLVPFVPRLTLEWLRDEPAASWRELEGTLAFIDISGFTAMSERLSSLGQAGAEEVTEVMNATFAALLGVAYAQGGGLLKFGGDALLLLYDGEEHARRAARAAFEMRRTLRAIGRPRTSAGAIQLKMHAGLHSGRFQFFLVGESHRELLIAGPAATRTVEMEATSEAGEILVSTETGSVLDADTLAEEKGNGRLLRSAPEVRGTVSPSACHRGHPARGRGPGAPARATARDRAARGRAPTRLDRLHPLLRHGRDHRDGGTRGGCGRARRSRARRSGGRGRAQGDLPRKRHRSRRRSHHPRVGRASDLRRRRGADAANGSRRRRHGPAAPGSHRCERGTRLHGPGRCQLPQDLHGARRHGGTRGAADGPRRRGRDLGIGRGRHSRRGSFEATELEPLTLKGKSEPVQAFVLGELLPEADRLEPGRRRKRSCRSSIASASGRCSAASVAPVRMGFGTLVELVGEPGIGKSRLAEELRENCADMRQISLRCEQYEASTPYYPFRPFLRSLLDVELNGGGEHNRAVLSERLAAIDEELVPWTPLLAAPLDVEVETTPEVDALDPSFWRARLHGVMGNAARAAARRADADGLRRRPLDGRRVLGAPALPRDTAPDAPVAGVHDSATRRRRLRRRRGNATPAGTDSPARAAARRTMRRRSRSPQRAIVA